MVRRIALEISLTEYSGRLMRAPAGGGGPLSMSPGSLTLFPAAPRKYRQAGARP
jgi:hypothetical protein